MAITIKPEIKQKIYAAANALKSRGETITNESVRDEMGGGSLSHVSPVMREWRREQEQSTGVMLEMPEVARQSIMQLSTELWKIADVEARKKVEIIQIDCDNRTALAENERDEALQEISRLEDANAQQTKTLERLTESIESANNENKNLFDKLQTTLLQLERAKVEAETAKDAKDDTYQALKVANANLRDLQNELVKIAQQSSDDKKERKN